MGSSVKVKMGLQVLCIIAAIGGPGGLVRPESFSQTVLRKCSEYIKNPKIPVSNKNCTEIQEAFRSAFISKDPCRITGLDYQPLMSLVDQTIPCNKVLFWSKTKKLAQDYAKTRGNLLTLKDTLLGYMADGLTWYSAPGSSDVKTESCSKEDKSCCRNVMLVFWDVASKWFAAKACGKVEVVLSWSDLNAYNKHSTFVHVEVPYLVTGAVSCLHAVLIHERGEQVRDSCSSSSIESLKLILKEKKIAFTCEETRAASSAQGDLLFLSPARGGALLIALLVTLASWTQM